MNLCHTCKHYNATSKGYGVCESEIWIDRDRGERLPRRYNLVVLLSNIEYPGVLVGRNFGCVHHAEAQSES